MKRREFITLLGGAARVAARGEARSWFCLSSAMISTHQRNW